VAVGMRPRSTRWLHTASTRFNDPPFWYTIYGLRVRSDFRLPVGPLPDGPERAPDLVFRRAPAGRRAPDPDGPLVAAIPCPLHGVDLRVHRGPGGAWIWNHTLGMCHVLPGARQVDVYVDPQADERALGFLLLGRVSVFILHQHGYPTLHASAVVTTRGAVAFLGPPTQGKSTMAAAFLSRGATFLTDDVLPLHLRADGVYGIPSPPLMKVWQPAADGTLRLSEELPDLWDNSDKKLLALEGRFESAPAAVRLRALYLLDRYDPASADTTDIVPQKLSGQERMAAVLGHTSYGTFLLPREAGKWLPIYASLGAQVPVRRLHYPDGFEHQDMVYARILQDLAEINGAQG
jgi:hypothetical protein